MIVRVIVVVGIRLFEELRLGSLGGVVMCIDIYY